MIKTRKYLSSVIPLSMNCQTQRSNIQEVKIAGNGSLSLVAVILLGCMALNAYTLFKVTALSAEVSKLIQELTPILLG